MMSLNQKNLLGLCVAGATLASSAVVFSANPAEAAIFTVNGTDYNITTVTGSFSSLSTQLQATPWWGDNALADSLATAVGTSFGLPNTSGQWGPMFSVSLNGTSQNNTIFYTAGGIAGTNLPIANTYTYAVGSAAVPEPLTILGAITATGFGVAFKRKKNSTKEE